MDVCGSSHLFVVSASARPTHQVCNHMRPSRTTIAKRFGSRGILMRAISGFDFAGLIQGISSIDTVYAKNRQYR